MRLSSIRNVTAALSAMALAAALASPAMAASTGTLTFTDPTGTVAGDQSIVVDYTVTLDADSAALSTDASGQVTSGYTTADLIAAGIDPALVASTDVNTSFLCSGTFTSGCTGGPPYDFDFAFGAGTGAFPTNLDLEPGTSTVLQFGTFVPTGGVAPAGNYTFFDAAIYIQFYDAEDNHLGDVPLFDTCSDASAACAFTRTVTGVAGVGGVPEPASWALMIGGFGLAGAALRRRRAVALV
jgi:PEP-CTERM motif